VTERADGLELRPATLHGGLFRSYADHRMAHAAAVLGSVVEGVEIDDVTATGKTFPDFPRRWADLVAAS
jgi:3-phosphoshikimate 1-carboxyvinyltransferase